ncbi:TauD/TfdA dioxygenase family protein [Actinomadura rupiterrae]|uniref:TauD/TfdA dioxygenase family protein n=1 Tax=Actinomadura rupiterrae TaxID=559627 RepID=UPI0020A5738D|nr:TauD/TfdA family dioxygenase [Actinomadura rupiterrae]MCP2339398.1 taurine dioxygenase [Actinomadura rupiterrae]
MSSSLLTSVAETPAADASTAVEVSPVAGRIGAVVSGVRLGGDLPDDAVAGIRAALLAHKVVFFRGQDHLDGEGQAAFARRLGALTTAHPTVPGLDGNDRILDLDYSGGAGGAEHWHTDVTFVDAPPAASVLRAVTIPPHGGDTSWANTAAAYDTLPAELRDLADKLWALHSNRFDYVAAAHPQTEEGRRRAEVFSSVTYETEHPVVRVHPETGERTLLLGGFARSLVGFPPQQSAALIKLFQEHITRLENTVRWTWAEGDLAIWDNRATQHRVVNDFGDQARRLQRITVVGDVPVSVDGRPSVSRSGDASAYNGHAG